MRAEPLTSNQHTIIAESTGTTALIVYCALTPCHEGRARRLVSAAKVEEIKRAAQALRLEEKAV